MRRAGEELTHSERRLPGQENWVFFVAHRQPRRLVVFVHGFRGGPVSSWRNFPLGGQRNDCWRESDLLFVGYPSERDNILGVSNRLRRILPTYYPQIGSRRLTGYEAAVRAEGDEYEELFLVGHSLGGVIVRRLVCDLAEGWLADLREDPKTPRPRLLEARVRLFSPASAGFRPGGMLGMLRALPTWAFVNLYLRRSTAFTDLQPDSVFLRETRLRTEANLAGDKADELEALRARIVWANPDDVVLTERYTSDRRDVSADGRSHSSVCKPDYTYELPWRFLDGS
jgi:pimeloyl-ACP methyl ester carboxylesterase